MGVSPQVTLLAAAPAPVEGCCRPLRGPSYSRSYCCCRSCICSSRSTPIRIIINTTPNIITMSSARTRAAAFRHRALGLLMRWKQQQRREAVAGWQLGRSALLPLRLLPRAVTRMQALLPAALRQLRCLLHPGPGPGLGWSNRWCAVRLPLLLSSAALA